MEKLSINIFFALILVNAAIALGARYVNQPVEFSFLLNVAAPIGAALLAWAAEPKKTAAK